MVCQTSDGRLKLRDVLNQILEEDGQKAYLPACPFCSRDSIGDVLVENSLALAFYDRFPVSPGHTLIIPKRHVASFFDLETEEHNQIRELGMQCRNIVQQQFHPDGFNIGVNVGKSAGQSVFHCHIHLIPRYLGDVANPRGGVRGVIPAKQNY
ncbi:MAG: HIT family protein [Lentisphaeria bacterium]|nr:HIT family protein [Lentisphaeria bacterium]